MLIAEVEMGMVLFLTFTFITGAYARADTTVLDRTPRPPRPAALILQVGAFLTGVEFLQHPLAIAHLRVRHDPILEGGKVLREGRRLPGRLVEERHVFQLSFPFA